MNAAAVILHVTVRGKVQGVGYRAFAVYAAGSLGLEGWVRNRKDGTVEAVVAGSAAALDKFVAECRRGPTVARVESIDVKPGTVEQLAIRPAGAKIAILNTV